VLFRHLTRQALARCPRQPPPHGLHPLAVESIPDSRRGRICAGRLALRAGGGRPGSELPRLSCVNRDREHRLPAGPSGIQPLFDRVAARRRSIYNRQASSQSRSATPRALVIGHMGDCPSSQQRLTTTCMPPSPAIDAACSTRRGVSSSSPMRNTSSRRPNSANAEGPWF